MLVNDPLFFTCIGGAETSAADPLPMELMVADWKETGKRYERSNEQVGLCKSLRKPPKARDCHKRDAFLLLAGDRACQEGQLWDRWPLCLTYLSDTRLLYALN